MRRPISRTLATFLALWLACCGAAHAAPDGDLDGDGKTTIKDALLVLRRVVKLDIPTPSEMEHGDVWPLVGGLTAPDHQLTIADALQLLRKVVGLTNWAVAAIPLGGELGRMAILPDGKKGYVARTTDNQVSVIDTDPLSPSFNTVLASIPVGIRPKGMALTPDSTRLYVTNQGGTSLDIDSISVISTASDQVITTISLGANTAPEGIAITPDGKRAYFTSFEERLYILDTDPASPTYNQTIGTIPRPLLLTGNIAITPDGTKAVVNWGGSIAHAVDVIDTDPASAGYNQVIATPVPVVSGFFGDVAIPPNGAVAYATNMLSQLCKIDLQSNTVIDNPVGPLVVSITLSPDGLTLLHSDFNSPKLSLIRASDMAVTQEIDFGSNLGNFVMVTPDGARAYVQRNVLSQSSELLVVPLH